LWFGIYPVPLFALRLASECDSGYLQSTLAWLLALKPAIAGQSVITCARQVLRSRLESYRLPAGACRSFTADTTSPGLPWGKQYLRFAASPPPNPGATFGVHFK